MELDVFETGWKSLSAYLANVNQELYLPTSSLWSAVWCKTGCT